MAKKRLIRKGDVTFVEEGMDVELFGDPEKQIESTHTRIKFPGGDIDLVRTTDNEYWVHIFVNREESNNHDPFKKTARIVDARLDIVGKSVSEADTGDFENDGLYHMAVRIGDIKEAISS